jgi:carbonic anhydrase/SulP family sulfate permease
MSNTKDSLSTTLPRDLIAGLVVFLVALPLCLGVALASNAPLFSGLIAGIVGGILVGTLSGSHTSVSGPAAGLTAVVAAQILALGSFPTFLLAVVLAGGIQVVLGLVRAGSLAAFFPSSVIKGLLAAIGVILILKQIPHVFGHDPDPEGDMAFQQPDKQNTFTEIYAILEDLHVGAAAIGLSSILLLVVWDRVKALKKSIVPAPLVIVVYGVVMNYLFAGFGKGWLIEPSHLVQVPVSDNLAALLGVLQFPDFSQVGNPKVYLAAVTIAAVASLETLLNLEAVDKLDPRQRNSPSSRELLAQGCGNVASGFLGGLPVTSVIIRSSVNINAGGRTKLSAIFHGVLLLVCVVFLPTVLNMIPLSCLAAILLTTGIKLASPKLFKQMWKEGPVQFLPFVATVVAIVFTDLLVGVLIGMAVSTAFILRGNLRRPIRRIVEKHVGGEVIHIQFASTVSFLNKAALAQAFEDIPDGSKVLLDAQETDYIDPDILDMIRDYKETTAPAHGIEVSLIGFKDRYKLEDQIQYVDYSTREIQSALTPEQVLQILKDGHDRFRTGNRLTRDLGRQVNATAAGQHPLAVILSCIDSRTPAELVFDLGVGDIFVVRIAGNVISGKVLGSIEYGTAVAGAKLVLVMGHTRCGAVTAAVNLVCSEASPAEATGCQHIHYIVDDIQKAIPDREACRAMERGSKEEQEAFVNGIARRNVLLSVQTLLDESATLRELVKKGRIAIVGAMYDVTTGGIEFLGDAGLNPLRPSAPG